MQNKMLHCGFQMLYVFVYWIQNWILTWLPHQNNNARSSVRKPNLLSFLDCKLDQSPQHKNVEDNDLVLVIDWRLED